MTFSATSFGIASDCPNPRISMVTDGRIFLFTVRQWVRGTGLTAVMGRFFAAPFGIATDKPVTGDYDGDGQADLAVYRDGIWYIQGSTQVLRQSLLGSPQIRQPG
jgi:hypothetical protein